MLVFLGLGGLVRASAPGVIGVLGSFVPGPCRRCIGVGARECHAVPFDLSPVSSARLRAPVSEREVDDSLGSGGSEPVA